jgi:hypothetical protein
LEGNVPGGAGRDGGRVVETGITVVWMTDPHVYAGSVQERVWGELSSRADWRSWLEKHILAPGRVSIVFYEERPDERLVIRGDTLRFVVPVDEVRTAFEKHDLPEFMAVLFREVYLAWAHKLGLPEPPAVETTP